MAVNGKTTRVVDGSESAWRSSGHHRWRCNYTFPPFPVFRCPQGISKLHSRPFLDVIFQSLLLSSSPSCSFHWPLQNCLRHTRGSWDVAIPSEFPFLYHGYEIIMHSSCILDSVVNLLVRHMVFVGTVQKSPIASHLKGLNHSLDFYCQGPALTGIKEGG